MDAATDRTNITPLYSEAEGLAPPLASYAITSPRRTVIIDPGPAWHMQNHHEELTSLVDPDLPLVVLLLSPGSCAYSSLTILGGLATTRTLITHWKTASLASDMTEGWRVRTLTVKRAALPLHETSRLTIGTSPSSGSPGALMAFERRTGTLFSGPFFGSIGVGQSSRMPVLARESARAYRDLFTPAVPATIVEGVFGREPAINRVAPSHGRMAVGGSAMIRTIFDDAGDGEALPSSLWRLYLRTAAIMGQDAASGIFRATGVPVPDTDTGYNVPKSGKVPGLGEAEWTRMLEAVEKWAPGAALAAILPVVVEMAGRFDLPLTETAQLSARATQTVLPNGDGWSGQTRMNGSPDMPGAVAPVGDDGSVVPTAAEITDGATGLMNERVFKQRLAGQFRPDEGTEGAGSLILIGIDAIQRINSNYGRKGGDDAIYTVAYLLSNYQAAHSRQGAHRLYKLTGPVYAYVLAAGSGAEGTETAEEIRRAVAESAMFLEQLTVSIGVVGLDEIRHSGFGRREPDELAGEATSRAFARLRVARAARGNTVCSSDPAGASVIRSGATILVADPDAPYLTMLTGELERRGYTVLLASDGSEATQIINQIVPDAIVAEVMLPKKNGFELREELRRDAELSGIPLVLVSHRKTDEMIGKAAHLGIMHFLAKPFSMVELVGLLGNLTRTASSGAVPEGTR